MRWMIAGMLVMVLSAGAAGQAADDSGLQSVALTTLGATAKGSGAPFNKDWPAINALRPGTGGGALFGSPLVGGRVDIRLVVPVDIKAIEVIGLDYHGTQQPKAVDIFVEGKMVKHAELPETPGQPIRIPLEARGQYVGIKVTEEYPVRTLADGRKGPNYGGWSRVRVLSTTDVGTLMKDVDEYHVAASPANIAPTSGSLTAGETKVYGEPRVTKGHPCTLWDQQDIDHYKAMLKTSQLLREQYEGLKRGMDKRITEPVGVPQPIKGADGKWQHLPDQQYGGTQNQLALDIANLGAMYVLSGEAKYADFAKKILLAYADVYDKYTPGNRPGFTHDVGKCFDQRLGDSTWLIQVARGYDLIYNLPSMAAEERKHIEDDLLKAAARFIAGNRAHLISPTNWSAIGTCSVLITGYATGDQELIDLAMYGPGGTKEKPAGGVMLHFDEKSIDADGMWSEGAMGYQFMALEALVADAEILWHHGIDMYRHRDAALKRLFDSPLEYSYPDLKTPAIHDSGHGSIVGSDSFLYEYAYRRYRDPKYLLILNQAGMHLDAQFQKFPVSVLYDRDPGEKAEAVEWTSINLFGVGYGILRHTTERGTVSLLMDYGPNRSHGHPDKLNIDLWVGGERLIPDPGSVWYEQPIYRNWYHTTMAHNTLCVDELEQQPCGADQLVYGPAETFSIQRARTNQAYAGVMMDRAVFLTPDYVADLFGAFARVPRKMDLCWHVRGEMATKLPLAEFELPEPRERGYNSLDNVKHATVDAPYQLTFARDDGFIARLSSVCADTTEVIVGNGHLGVERPTTLLQRREASQTIHANVIDMTGGEERYAWPVSLKGSLKDGYALMHVEMPRGTDLCFVSYRPDTYEVGGLRTDAQQAFVVRDGDAVRALYLGGGTVLEVGSASLRRSEAGLAYIEKIDNGAYIVGNPSPKEATVTVVFAPLNSMACYDLDAAGKRVGKRSLPVREAGVLTIAMKPVSRVEFAPEGQASVYEHRQAMLRKRLVEQEAALAKARSEALARTRQREAAAKATPVPAGTVVVVQAEDFSGQGGGEVSVTDQKRASIGKALLGWDGVGHWLEWTFDVPAEGCYNLTLCYCTELALCERELKVNGEVQEPFAPLVMPTTGGWARGSDDWRLFTAPNPVADHPLLVKLAKGKNVIRLTNLNGRGVNMDYLAVHSPDVQPTREMLAGKLK